MSEPSGTCRMIAAFSDMPVDSYWLPSGEFDYAAEEARSRRVWRGWENPDAWRAYCDGQAATGRRRLECC